MGRTFNKQQYMKQYNRQYYQRPEIKEQRRQYQQSPEYKEWKKLYRQRPEVKEQRRLYCQRPKVKERKKLYNQRPKVKERARRYHQRPEVRERELEQGKKRRMEQRLKVIELFGGKCIYCGCDNYRALEVNHRNGGGVKERKNLNGGIFYKKILTGERKTDDLELTCRVCNANHYLRSIGVDGLKVIWDPKGAEKNG